MINTNVFFDFTFEAETVVECVLALYRDRKEETAVLSKLEVLASTTMSSNKEREDFSRLIVSGGRVQGYTTTHVKMLALPVVRVEDKPKPDIGESLVVVVWCCKFFFYVATRFF